MTPAELREHLEVLRDLGVRRACVPLNHGMLEAEFFPPEAPPTAALVDRDGKPVNLDEGMPDDMRGDPILERNFAAVK